MGPGWPDVDAPYGPRVVVEDGTMAAMRDIDLDKDGVRLPGGLTMIRESWFDRHLPEDNPSTAPDVPEPPGRPEE